MAIEIRQVVIRAVVTPTSAPEPRPAPPPGMVRPSPAARVADSPARAVDQDALVAACVREVLRKLDRSRER
jgi:hypothetical protein